MHSLTSHLGIHLPQLPFLLLTTRRARRLHHLPSRPLLLSQALLVISQINAFLRSGPGAGPLDRGEVVVDSGAGYHLGEGRGTSRIPRHLTVVIIVHNLLIFAVAIRLGGLRMLDRGRGVGEVHVEDTLVEGLFDTVHELV